MKQKVFIIGNSFATRLGIIRSLSQVDCEIFVIAIAYWKGKYIKPIDCFSKYVKGFYYLERVEGEKGLVRLLLEKCTDTEHKNIIIPTSDFSAIAIDHNRNALKDYFLFPYISNSEKDVAFWMNKMNQKQLASQIGLKVASSIILESTEGHFVIPNEVKYPCFTKPLASIGGGKKCIRKCEDEKTLLEVLSVAEEKGITQILVEDYIKIDREYAALGCSDGENVIIPGIIQFVRGSKSHPGIALLGEVKPTDGFEQLIKEFCLFVQEIGYVGIFDIDFVESGGDFYFLELNLRIGGSAYAITKMGGNLPAIYVNSLTGSNVNANEAKIKQSAIYINERMLMDDWISGKLSTKTYWKLTSSADIHFVSDSEDSIPQKILKKEFLNNLFNYKRIVKRLLSHI